MTLVRVLRTFGNSIEGKRVKKGRVLDLTPTRIRALNQNAQGIKLLEEIKPDEAKALKAGGAPLVQVDRVRAPISRQIYPGGKPQRGQEPGMPPRPPSARDVSKERTAAPKPSRRGATGSPNVDPAPGVPKRLAQRTGGPTGAAAPASSSQADPALAASTSRPRGTRSPKQGGSRSTGPAS